MELSLNEIIQVTGAAVNTSEDIVFSGISTDTRDLKQGELFVALKGEKFNGDDYANAAFEKRAGAVLVSDTAKNLPDGCIILKVPDTLEAYLQIGELWRKKFDIPVIAITGSVGKTTTKDLTAAALSPLTNIEYTRENENNEIGVAKTVLRLNEKTRAAAVEIGMRGLGQISRLSKVVRPTIGIVTNVSGSHLGMLGSIENIAKGKGELVESLQAGSTVILNADNPYTAAMKDLAQNGVEVLTYSIKDAENISCSLSGSKFTFRGNDFEINLLGEHNISNALPAIIAAQLLNIPIERIAKSLKSLEPRNGRLKVIEKDGFRIINDAYNASPESMRAGLHTVGEIVKGRKICILGDMLELGENEKELHKEIGAEIKKNGYDALITLGELGESIAEGAKESGVKDVFVTSSHEEAAKKILEIRRKNDTFYFKASHGMHMEKIIELI